MNAPARSAHPLICPICEAGLHAGERTLLCPNGHVYDLARQGYVNLLIGHRARQTGDSRAMLRARRTFLEQGFYAPLSDLLNRVSLAHLARIPDPMAVLDVGCGEGYYLGRLAAHLEQHGLGRAILCLGMDVSKDAVRMAASARHRARFFVADVRTRILVADRTVSLLLNVFAPRNAAEFDRTTSTDGRLVIAIPGPTHLARLRARQGLLDIEEDKERHIVDQLAPAFHISERHDLVYEIDLPAPDVLHLLRMTPNYWHSDRQNWMERPPQGGPVRVHFRLLEFTR